LQSSQNSSFQNPNKILFFETEHLLGFGLITGKIADISNKKERDKPNKTFFFKPASLNPQMRLRSLKNSPSDYTVKVCDPHGALRIEDCTMH